MKVQFEVQCFDRPTMYYAGDTYEVSEETVKHFEKIGILGGKRQKAVVLDEGYVLPEKSKATILEPPMPKVKK